MGVRVKYNNNEIARRDEAGTITAKTAGKYLPHDIVIDYTDDSGSTPGEPVDGGVIRPNASYNGEIESDVLGAIAIQLGWRPKSLSLTVSGSTVAFNNIGSIANGTLLGRWEGSSTVHQGINAFKNAYPGTTSDKKKYYIVVVNEYGFSAQFGSANKAWSDVTPIAKNTSVSWTATVDTNQSRVVPVIPSGFIRANGNRLRDASGNAWVCRAINARLNLVLGDKEESERRPAEWELSQAAYNEIRNTLKFNTVKLLWSAHFFETEANPYNYRSEAWTWIDQNIKWAKAAGLKIMLNCHRGQGGTQYSRKGVDFWLDSSNQTRLYNLWKEIARRYKDEPTIVGYGIFNEPYILDDDDNVGLSTIIGYKYTNIVQNMIDAIRSVDTNHVIFADAALGVYDAAKKANEQMDNRYTGELSRYYWQTPIVYDHNICFEWHDYQPHNFTVQSTNITGESLDYPGPLYSTSATPRTSRAWQKEYMTDVTNKISNIYRKEVPIFIGEWGGGGIKVADTNDEAGIKKRGMFEDCFEDKMSVFNELGYGYAWHLWTGYSMGYHAVDPTTQYTGADARTWLTSVFTTGNETTQTNGTTEDVPTGGGTSGGDTTYQDKVVTPSASTQTITADSGKTLRSVTVNGDSDLIASNIRSGVSIFGVTGTMTSSGGGGLANDTGWKDTPTFIIDDENAPGYGSAVLKDGFVPDLILISGDKEDGSRGYSDGNSSTYHVAAVLMNIPRSGTNTWAETTMWTSSLFANEILAWNDYYTDTINLWAIDLYASYFGTDIILTCSGYDAVNDKDVPVAGMKLRYRAIKFNNISGA